MLELDVDSLIGVIAYENLQRRLGTSKMVSLDFDTTSKPEADCSSTILTLFVWPVDEDEDMLNLLTHTSSHLETLSQNSMDIWKCPTSLNPIISSVDVYAAPLMDTCTIRILPPFILKYII